jgi:hypothetical protein
VTRLCHAGQCDWHHDQYDHECDCGSTRPATVAWAKREVDASRHALDRAQRRLRSAEQRLAAMDAAKQDAP